MLCMTLCLGAYSNFFLPQTGMVWGRAVNGCVSMESSPPHPLLNKRAVSKHFRITLSCIWPLPVSPPSSMHFSENHLNPMGGAFPQCYLAEQKARRIYFSGGNRSTGKRHLKALMRSSPHPLLCSISPGSGHHFV